MAMFDITSFLQLLITSSIIRISISFLKLISDVIGITFNQPVSTLDLLISLLMSSVVTSSNCLLHTHLVLNQTAASYYIVPVFKS